MIGCKRMALTPCAPRRLPRVVAAVVALAVIGTVAAGCQGRPDSKGQARPSGSGVARTDSNPLGAGREVTLADVRKFAGFPVLTPGSIAGIQTAVSKVWVNSKLHQVALGLDLGQITIMMWPVQPAHENALKYFRAFKQHNHASIDIGNINGAPVLIIKPHTDFYKTNPAWVEFYRDGVDVNIYSSSFGARSLLRVARSMHETVSSP